MRLENKVALITGAASGIGKETAELFAREGASIILTDVNDTEGEAVAGTLGDNATYIHADVSKDADCQSMIAHAESTFGKLDILFNNAGIMHSDDGDSESTDEGIWDLTMNVNLKGVFLGCKHGIPALKRAGGGSIINISSLAALFGLPYGMDYVASKAAVIGMTRAMARELGRDRIRVNAVAPSAVMTEGTEEFFGEKFEKAKGVIAAGQLIQRNLEPRDLTGTILYLASDQSEFVTGQTHMVDGGSWFL